MLTAERTRSRVWPSVLGGAALTWMASWNAPSAEACSGLPSRVLPAESVPAGGALLLRCLGLCNGGVLVSDAATHVMLAGSLVLRGQGPESQYDTRSLAPHTGLVEWVFWKPDQPLRQGQTLEVKDGNGPAMMISVGAVDRSEPSVPAVEAELHVERALSDSPTCCDAPIATSAGECFKATRKTCYTPTRKEQAVLGLQADLPVGTQRERPKRSEQWVYRVAFGTSEGDLREETTTHLTALQLGHPFEIAGSRYCYALRAEHVVSGQRRVFPAVCVDNTLGALSQGPANFDETAGFLTSCPEGLLPDARATWCETQRERCRTDADSSTECARLDSACRAVAIDAGSPDAGGGDAGALASDGGLGDAPSAPRDASADAGGDTHSVDSSAPTDALPDAATESVMTPVERRDASTAVEVDDDSDGCAVHAGALRTRGLRGALLLGMFAWLGWRRRQKSAAVR